MGDLRHGRSGPGSAVVLGLLALVVLDAAGLVYLGLADGLAWLADGLAWLAVAVSTPSVAMNTASRRPGERRLWVPVGLILLATSLVVALVG